jgi:DNA-binding transcriptional LysR family regulator
MIAQLAAAHPQFDIELLEGDQQYVLGSLRGGEVELAVLYDVGLPDDIATLACAELDTHVLLPQDHRLAAQAQIGLEDLAAQPLILLDVVPSREAVLALFRERGLAPLVGYRTTSLEMVRGMVANGLGYSLLGTRPAHDASYDGRRLVTRPLSGAAAPSRLVLAHRAGQPLSAAALACAQHCIGFFSDHRF